MLPLRRAISAPVHVRMETLEYLKHVTQVWFEITTLLIPGHNDSAREVRKLSEWVMDRLGPDVPLHFTAFHPDYKMLEVPPTSARTLTLARDVARETGLHYRARRMRLHRGKNQLDRPDNLGE